MDTCTKSKMADEGSSKDFAFCVLCRKNHDQGRKHTYSVKHRKALESVLSKFGKKVDEVRKYLHKPSVEDGELEPGAKFWCHFCGEEVNKHVTDRQVSITYGGVFEHFASKSHHKKLHSFWKEHGAEKEKKANFLVTNEQYMRFELDQHIRHRSRILKWGFKEGVDKALKEHEEAMEGKREKEAERIKQIEMKQKLESQQPPEIQQQQPTHVIYKSVQNEFGIQQNPTGWHEGYRVWGGGIFKYRQGSDQWFPWELDLDDGVPGSTNSTSVDSFQPRGIQTAKAFGSNLTCIEIKDLAHGEGNIHSGAIPPWLRNDDDEDNDRDKKFNNRRNLLKIQTELEQTLKEINKQMTHGYHLLEGYGTKDQDGNQGMNSEMSTGRRRKRIDIRKKLQQNRFLPKESQDMEYLS